MLERSKIDGETKVFSFTLEIGISKHADMDSRKKEERNEMNGCGGTGTHVVILSTYIAGQG